MVPVEGKEAATDLERGISEGGMRGEMSREHIRRWRGLRPKGEARERQMEVAGRMELDTGGGEGRKGKKRGNMLIVFTGDLPINHPLKFAGELEHAIERGAARNCFIKIMTHSKRF